MKMRHLAQNGRGEEAAAAGETLLTVVRGGALQQKAAINQGATSALLVAFEVMQGAAIGKYVRGEQHNNTRFVKGVKWFNRRRRNDTSQHTTEHTGHTCFPFSTPPLSVTLCSPSLSPLSNPL